MNSQSIKNLVTASMLFAVGIVLPFATGQIPEIGNMLLPMHLPVLLCGFICGFKYGGAIGFLLPLMRSLMFGRPLLYPNAVAMAVELMAYGLAAGLIYMLFKKKTLLSIYISLVSAMLLGRIVWGAASAVLYGIASKAYGFAAFIAGAFVEAVPGIILQLILIPALVFTVQKIQNKPRV